ncbi:uncharacterized protein LOC121725302 [Aricia agestis]|uniref:uncharacterized protein LOC121725302 n=1 Tax=Aricia agestis TaxID=91739 RepID=UPI001C2088D3|nr:uncharacterized protein LOC121725302 [Aricia agestis]
MQKQRTCTTSSASARCLLVILLVACLAECGTEQRINNRGSKGNLINKVNGWRSQRGGSCLSYGHSCWGAHGKRSGTAPSSAPDWYITRILRRMAALNELQNRPRQNDESDILRAELEPEFPGRLVDEEDSNAPVIRSVDARPMLEDSDIPKMKIWQIMKAAAQNE